MKNKQKLIQYICNLIMEYWEEKKEIPDEPKKILLGFMGYINNVVIAADLEFVLKHFLNIKIDYFELVKFIYDHVWESVEFKIMCDELRDKNNE